MQSVKDKSMNVRSKQFDTLIEFTKEFFEIINFEKSQQTTKKSRKIPQNAKS